MPKIRIILIALSALVFPHISSAQLKPVPKMDFSCGLKLIDKNKKIVGFVADSVEDGFLLHLSPKGKYTVFKEVDLKSSLKVEGTYSVGDRVEADFAAQDGSTVKLVNTVSEVCVSPFCDLAKVSSILKLKTNKGLITTYTLKGEEDCFGGFSAPQSDAFDILNASPGAKPSLDKFEPYRGEVPAPVDLPAPQD